MHVYNQYAYSQYSHSIPPFILPGKNPCGYTLYVNPANEILGIQLVAAQVGGGGEEGGAGLK